MSWTRLTRLLAMPKTVPPTMVITKTRSKKARARTGMRRAQSTTVSSILRGHGSLPLTCPRSPLASPGEAG